MARERLHGLQETGEFIMGGFKASLGTDDEEKVGDLLSELLDMSDRGDALIYLDVDDDPRKAMVAQALKEACSAPPTRKMFDIVVCAGNPYIVPYSFDDVDTFMVAVYGPEDTLIAVLNKKEFEEAASKNSLLSRIYETLKEAA